MKFLTGIFSQVGEFSMDSPRYRLCRHKLRCFRSQLNNDYATSTTSESMSCLVLHSFYEKHDFLYNIFSVLIVVSVSTNSFGSRIDLIHCNALPIE